METSATSASVDTLNNMVLWSNDVAEGGIAVDTNKKVGNSMSIGGLDCINNSSDVGYGKCTSPCLKKMD